MCVFVFQIQFSTNIMPSRDSHYILRLLFVSKSENCVNVFCVTSFNQYSSKTGNPVYILRVYFVLTLNYSPHRKCYLCFQPSSSYKYDQH